MATLLLRGRCFSSAEITIIKRTVDRHYKDGRTQISKRICEKLNWRQPNGWLKERACRDVLLRLEERKILRLPRRKVERAPGKKIDAGISQKWLTTMPRIKDYFRPEIRMVKGTPDEKVWNELVRTFHYQSYTIIVGNNLKYIAYLNDVPVACLGWGSAAWSVEARDEWLKAQLGWKKEDISKNLHSIVNNVRFLILPWVNVKNLASTILAMMAPVVIKDWSVYYSVQPLLLETFVEKARFRGTCYKAANWIYVGATKGISKSGNLRVKHNNIKEMFVLPVKTKEKIYDKVVQIPAGFHKETGWHGGSRRNAVGVSSDSDSDRKAGIRAGTGNHRAVLDRI